MTYSIRDYRDSDAEALAEIIYTAIEEIGPRRYTAEQVAVWAARRPGAEQFRQRAAKGDILLVAVEETDWPVAYAILEGDGHLDHLYCHPLHSRKGLADKLLEEAENVAQTQGNSRLYTEASELARPSFERAGYSVSHRRDFDLGGVPIHNYAMEKPLS